MGRRREPRLKFEVQVKVCGMDTAGHPFVQTAYAVSISRSGVRLTGVGPLVRVGETVVVIYKQRKARFRVTWIGEAGQPETGQAGLVSADPNQLIWDFPLPFPGVDGYVPPDEYGINSLDSQVMAEAMPAQTGASTPSPAVQATQGLERRNAPRFKCRGSADIFVPNVSFPTRGQIDDISLNGVYIQTSSPLLVGSKVNLILTIQGSMVQAEGEVRTSHPGVGMGLTFTNMAAENRITLSSIVNRLAGIPTQPTQSARESASAPTPPQIAPAPRWDVVGRDISEWFRTHENLTREEFFTLFHRQ